MAGVCLNGQRVALREFEARDEEPLHAIASDPEVTRFTDWGPNAPADTRAFLATAMAQAESPGFRVAYHLAADDKETGGLVGSVGLDVDSQTHARAEVGFVFGRAHWGHGYAGDALRVLLDFAFGELGMHRVAATCHPDNEACGHVLERAGMRLEGRLRDHMLVRGQWRDSLVYARLATDFPT